MNFTINTNYELTGDQPKVITELTKSILSGNKYQTLLGVTGSGKTFCMANIIKNVNKPTLILSHNKTLAAQLYSEFKDLFPNNAVEYFVSHYNYFQPECYLPIYDKYIAKETDVNDEIERMRQRCIQSLLTRKDVIVIASVSALFGVGNPKTYYDSCMTLSRNQNIDRDDVIQKLIRKQYERNDLLLASGTFRVKGDVIDICLSTDIDIYYRINFFGDIIENICKIDINTNKIIDEVNELNIFNISSYVVEDNKINKLCNDIQLELDETYDKFKQNNELIYAQRILERTSFDIDMLKDIGYCKGLESYQRYLTDRPTGSAPYSLLDFFPKDYLMIIDESHMMIPQIKSIGNQSNSIKSNLINYGFRLPSCVDNRPLNFSEFESYHKSVLFVSATPDEYETNLSSIISEQIIRPTGLLDPEIIVRPIKYQIDDMCKEINNVILNKNKVLISVITKQMAESLSDYLNELSIKACYLHSDVDTLDRINIINNLQQGKYDVLIGCNLLREGLSISNCELVIILDADKEGFLRNKSSLIQMIGRAARNKNGRAILYADNITKSIQEVVNITNRHREIQDRYNKENNIVPQSTNVKLIKNVIGINESKQIDYKRYSKMDLTRLIEKYHKEMVMAADILDFEEAIRLRDIIQDLEYQLETSK